MKFLRRIFSKAKKPEMVWVQCPKCGAIQQAKDEYIHKCVGCNRLFDVEWNTVSFCDIHHIYYEAGNVCGECLSESDRS